jgi:hypothetical protein
LGSGQPSFTQIAPSNYINFDGTATFTIVTTGTALAGISQLQVASTASIQIGDAVVFTTGTTVPGNTLITSIGGNTLNLTNQLVGAVATGTTLTIYRNQWAVPGETIFSTVSNPGSKDVLDLSQLKELTNTPLGGRGTYPNGPDTLFVNVYLTQGSPLLTNLVLRWGEAQA